jgi:transcriptional regulator with GAF, ATPase, and Fis domain
MDTPRARRTPAVIGCPRMQVALEVYRNGKRIRAVALDAAGVTIGRDGANTLVLDDPRISRRHCRVSISEGGAHVVDLGSASGIRSQGNLIREAVLNPGDEFALGPYTVRVVAGAPATVDLAGDTELTSEEELTRLNQLRHLVRSLFDLTNLVGVSDLQSVLETLLDGEMSLVSGRRGFVVLVTPQGLSPILARKGSADKVDQTFSRTVCERALESGAPVLISGPGARTQLQQIRSFHTSPPVSVMVVPLVAETPLGVLYLETNELLPAALEDELKLLKDISALGGRALRSALDRQQIVADSQRWRWLAQLTDDEPDLFRSCRSRSMSKVAQLVQKVAAEDITSLILGESGTGKEVVARTIHRLSRRRDRPFVAINCGAIPHDLLEGEVFGHEKGAFTGAVARKQGRLALAQGGTLFLDEIGDLPKDLQVKLLRVLEARTYEPLGSEESVRWEGRILAATNRDLENAVARGDFREDLFYRLNVISIALPSLRERREDLDYLVSEILLATNRRFQRKLYGVAPDALARMQTYTWPGNVRELRNVIERAFVLETGDCISLASLAFPEAAQTRVPTAEIPALPPAERATLAEFVRRQEIGYIQLVLEEAGGSITRAAQVLGLARETLHRKIRQLGIRTRGHSDDRDDVRE